MLYRTKKSAINHLYKRDNLDFIHIIPDKVGFFCCCFLAKLYCCCCCCCCCCCSGFSVKTLCCGCSLEAPRRGASNEYPLHMFSWRNKKKYFSGYSFYLELRFRFRVFHLLWKHTYSNILKISPPKTESFQRKILIFFHISTQNIDCGYSLEPPRRGGSNGYPQSMFLSRNKKNNVYPCKPQFYYIKVGFKGVKTI